MTNCNRLRKQFIKRKPYPVIRKKMYQRLITDWGILSAPQCTPGAGWNSMELWSQLTVMYCCWVRSTWKLLSQSTFEWIWEACATGAANSISLHQAQLCLNIFSKWKLLKEAVLWLFWKWCHLSSAVGWAFHLAWGWQDYFEVRRGFIGGCGLRWEGHIVSHVLSLREVYCPLKKGHYWSLMDH